MRRSSSHFRPSREFQAEELLVKEYKEQACLIRGIKRGLESERGREREKQKVRKMTRPCQKDTGANLNELPMAKAGAIRATEYITIMLGYNPPNKIYFS